MFNTVITFAIYSLSAAFLLGMAGSAVVILISFFEDFSELFSDDEVEPLHSHPPIN